ncbi:YihY/virulence factor BrkB family protein [Cellulomonas xylanilytica]|uniref:YihY/virulence factor BrkB family protein n=1 Tax=Cellulomonas xylanilytica TaxID=233583 RepID=A0A510V718_9CELL|nr:YhjD/YihY/BrkB family envelope integrity protein [Cellulomonas xylanilytica]GEK22669.1 hypothetical protein CXY01_31890 [Cellulomonas xylanilytica]
MSADEARPAVAAGAAQARAEEVPPPSARPPAKPSLGARAAAGYRWWRHTRPGRASARFHARSGGVLAGGIAYAALFSVFAALALSYTVLITVLGDNVGLQERVLVAVDSTYPRLLDTGDGQGVLDPASLELPSSRTLTGVVAVVVLLLSAIAAMTALRRAVRAMFAARLTGNMMLGKARDLGGFVGMVLVVLVSALLTTGVGTVASWVLDALGWDGLTTLVLQALGVLVAFLVDAAIFLLVVRVLAGEDPPRPDLLRGALLAATGLGIARMLGTAVIASSVSRNPLVTSVAVLVTVLVWVNVVARIVLLAAAWTADPPFEERAPSTGHRSGRAS